VLDNWPSLMIKLQSERDLAEENAEYLSTLQEFFIVSIEFVLFYFFTVISGFTQKSNRLKKQIFYLINANYGCSV